MTYALDTNAIIHILRHSPTVLSHRDEAIQQGASLAIPPYVNYEVRRGFRYISAPAKEQTYERICACCPVGEMNAEIWIRAASIYANLRRSGYTVSDADILIAAFCAANGYTLVTANTKDFENIDDLQVVNWTVSP
jgi:tRNA(fMet)-specific endonuclease VapC